jgi:ribose transport system ATP-binding protein
VPTRPVNYTPMSYQPLTSSAANAAPLLQITSANKAYHGIPALINASLTLQAGEVHALIGENGAGKSTLIKLLAGVLPADSITIHVHGEPVSFREARDAFNAGLRFIHQELNAVPTLSVAENIFLNQRYPTRAGIFVRWSQINRQASAVLAQLGVGHISPQQIMARLSPGDQMLVKIASAFVGASAASPGERAASIYVMDEPTAALSTAEAARLFDVIDRLRHSGCAILYVTHRLDEIFQIADRVTILRDGRVVETVPIKGTTAAALIRMMTGRDLQQVYPPRDPNIQVGERVMLDVRGLTTHAIHNVSFQLQENEILGIAGLNGSGRTELLRALINADRVRAGVIILNGVTLQTRSPAEAWTHGIAYVPEERRSQGLILSRSISDNITLPHLRHLARGGILLNHQRERRTSVDMSESVRLKAAGVNQATWQLSGGNQQKTVFARALAGSPQVLLLDEPTRGVDVGAKFDIYTLIRAINARGTGIIMVSSDLPELIGMCDRILIVRDGALVHTVRADKLTENELLSLCYGELSDDNPPTSQ